jgi:hypothetical protein
MDSNRPHKNKSIQELIRQMLHSQHKESTDQSDGDTVKEWRDELELRILGLLAVCKAADHVIEEFRVDDQIMQWLVERLREINYDDLRWLENEQAKHDDGLNRRY